MLLLLLLTVPAEPAAAQVPRTFAGIYTQEPRSGSASERLSVLRAQVQAGAGVARIGFPWTEIEVIPGYYEWSETDRLVTAAATAGIDLLPVLISPPIFRSSAPPGEFYGHGVWPPEDPADMARFAAEAVRRYGSGGSFWTEHPELPYAPVRSWQVWNEPNVPFFWPDGPDAAEYVQLLKPTAEAIRQADPAAEVVTAGIPSSRIGVPLHTFITALYDAGIAGSFDVLAVHPYAEDPTTALSLLETTRKLMDARGDSSPMWATEFGWATDGSSSPFTTDEPTHAAYIWEALHLFADDRARLRLRGFVLYNWRDQESSGGSSEAWPAHAGLLRLDGSRKPGYNAFRDAVLDLTAVTAPPGSTPGEPAAGEDGAADGGTPSARLRIIVGRRVRARHGHVRVKLRCLGRERCRGTLWLQRRWRPGRPRLKLGHRTFSVPAGRDTARKIRLAPRARRALGRARRMRVLAGASVPGAPPASAAFMLLRSRH